MKKRVICFLSLFLVVALLCACAKDGEGAKENGSDDVNKESMTDDEKKDSEDKETKDESVADSSDSSSDDSEKDDSGKDQDTTENQNAVNTDDGGNPVASHGKLSVKGTQLVDANKNPYQLRGVSTHGIAWFPEYVNKDAFKTMKEEWGINCVRLAMYSGENDGYCTGGSKSQLKELVNNGVSYATELGLYVIIDWHVLGDQDPNVYKDEAKKFFEEMSSKYKDSENVLYEICNEPNGGTTWGQVKSYAEEVIPIIKKNDPNAIIIVGTPTWSQDVDIAAKDPVTGYNNIMYTIHFYADTHRDNIRQKMLSALDAGLPVFCSEFGICDASGSGANNYDEGNTWIQLMDEKGISYCIWNLSNKNETSSLIKSGCDKTSGWTKDELSESGLWYVGILDYDKELGSSDKDSSDDAKDEKSSDDAASENSSDASADTGSDTKGEQVESTVIDLKMTAKCSNQWNDGKKNFYQIDVTIKNNGSKTVSGWTASVNFNNTVTIDQSWNGNYTVTDKTVSIKPVDYNSDVAAGQSVDIGFIICSEKEVKIESVK